MGAGAAARPQVVAPRYQNYDEAWETGVRLRLRVFDAEQEVSRTENSRVLLFFSTLSVQARRR